MPQPHLWEIDHPYYCQEGNYFKAGQHTPFTSWTDFTEDTIFVTADRDQNLLIRWDWRKPGFHDWDGEEYLLLFFVLQRKAWLLSVEMPVTEADEPAVRKFLTECAQTMRATWEPLLTERDRCVHSKAIHNDHHTGSPVPGCSWCTTTNPAQPASAGRTRP